MATERRSRSRVAHDRRVLLLALASGSPALIVAIALLWIGDHDPKTRWTLALLMVGGWLGFAFAARERVMRSLQTLSNMLAALREGDFSIRARVGSREDPLGLAFHEANTLSETLREQRLGALEATALLQRVMEEIDVAVFAFDSEQRLKLVNRAGERLLGRPAENLVGRSADELALREALTGEAPRVFDESFPGGAGRWEVRRSEFRQGGTPHRLLVLADLSRTLREEERVAWQRLVRVLSHEINNSLAPIKSIAESLQSMVSRGTSPEQLEGDVKTGLGVVAARAESLSRFMAAHARLARLPRPRLAATEVEPWVRRVVASETRLPWKCPRADRSRSLPTAISSTSSSSIWCGTRPTRRSRPAAECASAGRGSPVTSRSGSRTTDPDSRTPRISSCPSSPPSRTARVWGSRSAARSRRRTAGR